MQKNQFTDKQIRQIEEHGLSFDTVSSQIEKTKKGITPLKLVRPCITGDGILVLTESQKDIYKKIFDTEFSNYSCKKFIPASGAATRMFRPLLALVSKYDKISQKQSIKEKNDPDFKFLNSFLKNIKNFAFYAPFQTYLKKNNTSIDQYLNSDNIKPLLEALLLESGLNFANSPKALIPFHKISGKIRTPILEHSMETLEIIKNTTALMDIHFTISPFHRQHFEKHIESLKSLYPSVSLYKNFSFSVQDPSTDSLAFTPQNTPFSDSSGNLVFHPSGHGALLSNLNQLAKDHDILFLKNIDNIQKYPFKKDSILYTRILSGLLISVQKQIFSFLRTLKSSASDSKIDDIITFLKTTFFIETSNIRNTSKDSIKKYLIDILNRPIRICGLVPNEGKTGGLPFWIENTDKTLSPQIVESSQIDFNSSESTEMIRQSTHFNPVFIVLAVKNYQGTPFNLMNFSNPDNFMITSKSHNGHPIKLTELPGLWNSGMYHWNTLFVEIPETTFSPVKSVLDLLSPAHS